MYGQEEKAALDAEVLPKEDLSPLGTTAAPKADDAAPISKALDKLETQAGKTPELAAARQALRRLEALARLKSGD